jgi:hypothetical protein
MAEPGPRETSPRPAQAARGALRPWIGLACVTAGLAFLLNPGADVLELLPDTAPLIGNLDEAAATLAIVLGIRLAFR